MTLGCRRPFPLSHREQQGTDHPFQEETLSGTPTSSHHRKPRQSRLTPSPMTALLGHSEHLSPPGSHAAHTLLDPLAVSLCLLIQRLSLHGHYQQACVGHLPGAHRSLAFLESGPQEERESHMQIACRTPGTGKTAPGRLPLNSGGCAHRIAGQ